MKRFELNYYYGWRATLPMENQLFLTLMKLRLNLTNVDLAVRFSISETTVSNVFLTLLYALHSLLFLSAMASIPTPSKAKHLLPDSPCSQIWDCTDVFISAPRCDTSHRRLTYSQYRGGYTLKALVVVSPDGAIIFVSDLFSGGASEKEVVRQSGILSRLNSDDVIYADKGFLVADLLPAGVNIEIPSFLDSHTKQLTPDQITRSKNISKLRIHVERAIGRIKNFSILRDVSQQYRSHFPWYFRHALH
jgi:hypothetical protein